MKIFVTGATGFLGRHLTPKLKEYVAYTGDILDKEELTKQMAGCNFVIHLAAKFGKVNADMDIYKVNVVGTANVVQAMYKNRIKDIIFTSSCGADDRFINAYDDSKFIAEKVLISKHIEPTILRLTNLYGEDQKDKLITNLIKGFESGEVNIYGDGKQTRDLIHVDDVVQAILSSLIYRWTGEPLYIGSGRSYSILKVIEIMSEISGKKVKINFLPYPVGTIDFRNSRVDIGKAKDFLGYQPMYNLEKGLRKIWKY